MVRRLISAGMAVWMAYTSGVAFAAFKTSQPGMFLDAPSSKSLESTPPVLSDEKEPPVVINADEMGFDQQNEIVIARGNVQVQQGDYIVTADQITYFQRHDTVIAEGNVVMVQPTGDVFFSDRAELNQALKTGVISNFQARMSDNSVMVAEKAVRHSPGNTNLTNAEYTPCNLCQGVSPFWQLNSNKVNLDQVNDRVSYEDATLDIKGVPVFYTPYLSHPTPDAPAQSGFLPAQYGNNTNLGVLVRTPYYWRLSPDKELTVIPWYTSKEGPLLQGTYKQLLDNGEYDIQASGTNPQKLDSNGNVIGGNDFRGHINAKGYQNTGDISRVGFDIQRASDDTYLRRYSLGDQRSLFSRAYAEMSEDRNYASIQGLAIQGLRATDNRKTTPFVLPMLQAYYETPADENGIRYHVAGDAQMLSRSQGVDQRRVSNTVGATLPYVTDGGHVFTSTLDVRQDVYQTDNISPGGTSPAEDASNYRIVPRAALEWRYPLMQHFGTDSMTIEPIMLAVVQPRGGNPTTISNEDSRLLELTDTNLFSLDRMPGLDLIDTGPRIAYGARAEYMFSGGTSMDALLGQDYNPNSTTPFPNSTAVQQDFSDYIGRVAFTYNPFTVAYRFALDRNGLGLNRNEATVSFAKPWASFSTSYRSIRNNSYLKDSQEGDAAVTVPIGPNWSVYGSARRNFTLDQFVSTGSGIVFKNECFNIGLDILRIYTRDRDVEPSSQFMLHVALKNLGEFGGK